MLVSMIFVYYLLARAEERECMEKYPETYPPYFNKTGMFLPSLFGFVSLNISLPKNKFLYGAAILLIYFGAVGLTILFALTLRNYTISKMSTTHGKDYAAVSVTYIDPEITRKTVDIMLADSAAQSEMSKIFIDEKTKIFYVMPHSWVITELGMATQLNDRYNPQAGSLAHGNSEDTTPSKKRVLVSQAKLIMETEPTNILNYMKQQIPKLYVDIDLEDGKVIGVSKPPKSGIYSDIPVPMF